jgi:type III restriction enzyme
LRKAAVKQAYQHALFGADKHERVKVGAVFEVVFSPQAYAPSRDYDGCSE